MAEGNSRSLVSKPSTKSVAWEYFGVWSENGKIVDDGIAVCRSFRRNVVAKQGTLQIFYPIFEQDTANYTVKSVWR